MKTLTKIDDSVSENNGLRLASKKPVKTATQLPKTAFAKVGKVVSMIIISRLERMFFSCSC